MPLPWSRTVAVVAFFHLAAVDQALRYAGSNVATPSSSGSAQQHEDSWASVGEPIMEQSAKMVDLTKQAQEAAEKASLEAHRVQIDAVKAGSSMTNVLAKVGAAKAAMEQAVANEKEMTELRDKIWQKAKAAAIAEIPKILPAIRREAEVKANEEAQKRAKAFGQRMKEKATKESNKAAKVYTDLMTGAGNSAADYAKLGDQYITQAADMQMNAAMTQGQANQYVTIGDLDAAQKLMQQSRGNMNIASGLNEQAAGMYDVANKITAQLPAYAGQAAMAAYHAQVMYDPNAVPPSPPLVLAQQQHQRHTD